MAGVNTLFSPRYKGCDFVVGEGMLKEKHTPEEKPDGVSGQIPPSHRDQRWGLSVRVFSSQILEPGDRVLHN